MCFKWQRNWNGQDSSVPCSNPLRHEDTQVYGTILPKELTNLAMLESKAYQTYYAFAFREKSLKPKYVQRKADSGTSPKKKTVQATKGTRIKSKAKVEQNEAGTQMKQTQFHSLSQSGSAVMHVGHSVKESEEESWTFSQGDDEESDGLMQGKRRRKKGDDEAVSLIRECQPPDYESLNDEDVKRVMIRIRKHMEDTLLTSNKLVPRIEQQSSSISSDLVSKFINPSPDIGIDSILNQDTQSDTLVNVPVLVAAETPSFFDQRVSALESEMSEFRQTSQFAEAVSLILGIVDTYLASKMKEAVDGLAPRYCSNVKRHVLLWLARSLRASVYTTPRSKEAESSKEPKNKESKSTSSSKSASKSQPKSSGKSAHTEGHMIQLLLQLEDQHIKANKATFEDESPVREALNEDVWHRNPSRPPTPDREWHKTKIVDNRPLKPWIHYKWTSSARHSISFDM
ncbi:hypothetical protein Tco_0491306 [Tanacetum coccineum]